MVVTVLNCPACGGSLDVDENSEILKCKFCGQSVYLRRRDVNSDGSITVNDVETGMRLGTVCVPANYKTEGRLIPQMCTYTFPFGVLVSAWNERNCNFKYFVGEAYTDRSRCPLLSGNFSQGMEQISKISYRNFLEAEEFVDQYALSVARSLKAKEIKYVEDRQNPLYEEFDRQKTLDAFKIRMDFERARSGVDLNMFKDLDYYGKPCCRVYDVIGEDKTVRIAVFTLLLANKYQFLMGGFGGFGGFGGGFGNGFGGMFGGLFGGGNNPSNNPAPAPSSFGSMPDNGIIEWMAEGIFVLEAPVELFDREFEGAFRDFCSTFRLDEGIREKYYNMQTQILQNIANHTNQTLSRMSQQFQTWQSIHASQQAAYDSYNQAWWNRSNATYNANRAAYQSRQDAYDRMSEKYSEAIRGVNTYTREDGSSVEVSVDYDRAYVNNTGTVIGSNSAFGPGADWTELKRKN